MYILLTKLICKDTMFPNIKEKYIAINEILKMRQNPEK